MLRRPPHRIRRQRWRVAAKSEEQAFALSLRLRAELDGVLLPALAAGFDEVVGDEVIRLARLELRVRIAGVEDVATKLPDLLVREAAAQVRAHTDRRVVPVSQTPERQGSPREDGVRSLARYLESGALPWQHSGTGDAEIRAELESAVPAWLREAVAQVRASPRSRSELTVLVMRLLQLRPERDWVAVATTLTADVPALGQARVIAAVAALVGEQGSVGTAAERDEAWVTVAKALTATPTAVRGAGLNAAVAAKLQARAGSLTRIDRLRLVAATLAAARVDADLGETETVTVSPPEGPAVAKAARHAALLVQHWLTGSTSALARRSDHAPRRDALRFGVPWADAPAVRTSAPDTPVVRARPRQADDALPGAPAEPFALLVSHGGLILLHPFLPQLFERSGIATGSGSHALHPSVLPRAAAMLYLLATGRAEAHEFELGFIKVLLGVPLDEPLLVAEGLLSDRDLAEVNALIEAVVGHWPALRGTSADGLRASFLQRPALLREESDGWRLRVQPHAIDVLLNHLPWSIGVARLPWMAQPVFAEWHAP